MNFKNVFDLPAGASNPSASTDAGRKNTVWDEVKEDVRRLQQRLKTEGYSDADELWPPLFSVDLATGVATLVELSPESSTVITKSSPPVVTQDRWRDRAIWLAVTRVDEYRDQARVSGSRECEKNIAAADAIEKLVKELQEL